jgi:hypothetical protein
MPGENRRHAGLPIHVIISFFPMALMGVSAAGMILFRKKHEKG